MGNGSLSKLTTLWINNLSDIAWQFHQAFQSFFA
jgi:hypothetical protein